ncbi:Nif11-like leader peptide family natural product precursor [Cyanobium sp. WAJ14-Wanaka]|uniref:Nif11-like leader peptide family natural product precursor n=1 Tax=Cyanobium sp. WAJ14-Wanaka TaxID=2823725 RepID=UPI0020CBFFE6|nr:Nif11-like leader peptide family natural product precursor [Cyanobium sp. WAJ14-Wanaka]
MEPSPPHYLDALDHLCHQVDGDPEFGQQFYEASTPEQMVELAMESGILIDADDFRALLRSGSTEFWEVRGDEEHNPITHLQRVFRISC